MAGCAWPLVSKLGPRGSQLQGHYIQPSPNLSPPSLTAPEALLQKDSALNGSPKCKSDQSTAVPAPISPLLVPLSLIKNASLMSWGAENPGWTPLL